EGWMSARLPPMPESRLDRQALGREIDAQRTDFVSVLKSFIECPSVSMQAEHKKDCRAAAEVACQRIVERGGRAEAVETGGNPVVGGTFEGPPGSPVVSIYNHLDVQPAAEGADGWTRPPFRFAEEGDRFYGRGATDDKGPAATALLGAVLARK